MRGNLSKRCKRCGRRVERQRCAACGGSFSWGFVIDIPGDAYRSRRQLRRGGFRTRGEAEEQLETTLAELQNDTFVEPTPVSLAEYLEETWLPATQPPQVRWQTWHDRRQQLRAYVLPRIGNQQLQKLNPTDLNRLYAELLDNGRTRGEGGLSASSVHAVHRLLRKALNDAVRWGLIKRNPALLADPPPQKVVRASYRRSMRTWNAAEVHQFLVAVADHHLYPVWHVALATGVRRSELLGLRWRDVDLEAGVLTVTQTVLATETGHGVVEDHKSEHSARTIHLDDRTCQLLRRHRDRQQQLCQELRRGWDDEELVFCDPDGSPYQPARVSQSFRRLVKRLDLPRIRFHDLRHTHASLLLQQGVHPKVVSERLGHSSVAFTLDIYAHVLPGMQPQAAELFASLVQPDHGPPPELTGEVIETNALPAPEPADDEPEEEA